MEEYSRNVRAVLLATCIVVGSVSMGVFDKLQEALIKWSSTRSFGVNLARRFNARTGSSTREAGASIKPGVEGSGTPGMMTD